MDATITPRRLVIRVIRLEATTTFLFFSLLFLFGFLGFLLLLFRRRKPYPVQRKHLLSSVRDGTNDFFGRADYAYGSPSPSIT